MSLNILMPSTIPSFRHLAARGFTLIEMAIVLIILTLVVGGALVPLGAQIDQRQRAETQKALDEAKEALVGFAVANKRLPCPDTDKDGLENQSNTNPPQITCTKNEGLLPYQTLGITRGDSWSNRIGYRVTGAWANSIGVNGNSWGGVDPSDGTTIRQGDITIATRGDDPATTSTVESKFQYNIATNVPAILISFGKNGYDATGIHGEIRATVPAVNADETTNANPGSTKFSRLPAGAVAGCSDTVEGKPACEFDDIVTWLSPNILYNRMVAAGRLP